MRLSHLHRVVPASAAVLSLVVMPALVQAKPSLQKVALRSTKKLGANEGRHIGVTSKGGLWLGSKILGNKEVFTIVDLNGGALKNGDTVQITYDGSYWQEDGAKITRTRDKPGAKCLFKAMWVKPNQTLQLRTAKGKYVSGAGKGAPLMAIAKPGATTEFQLVKNPKPAPKKP